MINNDIFHWNERMKILHKSSGKHWRRWQQARVEKESIFFLSSTFCCHRVELKLSIQRRQSRAVERERKKNGIAIKDYCIIKVVCGRTWAHAIRCDERRRALLSLSQWQYHFIFGSRTIFVSSISSEYFRFDGNLQYLSSPLPRLSWLWRILSTFQEPRKILFSCLFFCHPEPEKTTKIPPQKSESDTEQTDFPAPVVFVRTLAGSVFAQFRRLVILQHRK